jgi:subtilisin family serine protease
MEALMNKITTLLRITSTRVLTCPFAGIAAQPGSKSTPIQQSQLQQKPQQEPKIHPEVRRKAQEDGVVQVFVRLNLTTQIDSDLNPEERKIQRARIAETQNALLKQLSGKKFKILRKFEDIPTIGLEIDPSAILILENSNLVKAVHVSKIRRYSLAQAVPKVGGTNAWESGFDGTGQTVAIIDTGVSRANSFLQDPTTSQSKLVAEFCYSVTRDCPNGTVYMEGDYSATPCVYAPIQCEHGTQMAGAAAGNAGVAKKI